MMLFIYFFIKSFIQVPISSNCWRQIVCIVHFSYHSKVLIRHYYFFKKVIVHIFIAWFCQVSPPSHIKLSVRTYDHSMVFQVLSLKQISLFLFVAQICNTIVVKPLFIKSWRCIHHYSSNLIISKYIYLLLEMIMLLFIFNNLKGILLFATILSNKSGHL